MADWISLLAQGPKPDDVGASFSNGYTDARKQQQSEQDRALALQGRQQALASQAAARTGIAAALASGDYNRAAGVAAQYGDDKSAGVLATVGKNQFEQSDKSNATLANLATSLRQMNLPDGSPDMAARIAATQQAKPFLVAGGANPSSIDSIKPDNNFLDAWAHSGYSLKDQVDAKIAQQNADSTSFNAQTGRITATNPVVVGEGGSLVGRDGNLVYQAPKVITANGNDNVTLLPGTVGNAPISQQSAWAGMIRAEGGTNRDGSFRTSPKGAVGPAQVMPGTAPGAAKLAGLLWDPQRYASDPQYNLALGQAYHNSLVQRFGGDIPKSVAAYNAGPARVDRAVAQATKAGDPSKWPNYLPGETQGYLQKVIGGPARAAGAPIRLQNAQDPNAVSGNDPAVELAARQYAATGEMPPLGNGNGPMRKAILTRAAQIAQGWSPAQIQANKADMKSSAAALANDSKSYDTIQGAEQTALANGQVFLDRSRVAPGNTAYPFYNSVRNGIGAATGDHRVTEMNASDQPFITHMRKSSLQRHRVLASFPTALVMKPWTRSRIALDMKPRLTLSKS